MSETMAQYPQCLIAELAKYGRQPTGNKDWDAAVLSVLRKNEREKDAPWLTLHQCALNLRRESEKARAQAYNLADPNVYNAHCSFLVYIANSVVLAPQRRKFIVDDDNKQVLRFLLLYFNNCPLAEGRITKEMEPYLSGDFDVVTIKRTNYSEIVDGLSTADKWFKAKLVFITIDEKSGKEKKTATHFIVSASDINNAHICVVEHMKGSVMDFEIATLDETKIMDIFRYKPNTANG
jgi:hypothetical protein